MLKIRLALTAENDLENIWIYTITEWSEEQADKYLGLIEQGFSQLLDNPYLGKSRQDIKKGYRALQVQKHLIFYRVGTEYIDILGVPHIRMDAKRHFESN
jgi:toxin ParE1/3/4